jgi:hypothetical protein
VKCGRGKPDVSIAETGVLDEGRKQIVWTGYFRCNRFSDKRYDNKFIINGGRTQKE